MTGSIPYRQITHAYIEAVFRYGPRSDTPFIFSPDQVTIKDCEIEGKINKNYPYAGSYVSFTFEHCWFRNEFNFQNFDGITQVQFIDCVFEDKVSFENIHIPLQIVGCQFKQNVLFSMLGQGNLNLSGSAIDNEMRVTGRTQTKIILDQINFTQSRPSFKGDLLIGACICPWLTVSNVSLNSITILSKTRFAHEAIFENVKTHALTLNDAEIGLLFHIKSGQIDRLTIDNIGGPHRYLKVTDNAQVGLASVALHMLENTTISDCNMQELRIWSLDVTTNRLSIQKTTFQRLIFEDVYNEGAITLRELSFAPDSMLSIKSCNLGKADFILCDFSKATLEFENSKITELFLSETEFSTNVHMNGKAAFGQAQLAFGQLTTASKKQGDSVRGAEYQSREIEAHYRNLKNKPGNRAKKFNLWLNYVSTNFGRSWTQGILFTFGLGAIFYYALVVSSKEYHIAFGLTFDGRIFASYLKFMNPLRFFDPETIFRMNTDKPFLTLSGSAYLWDYLGRIVVAFGFYQTIQAFRRYGRSN